MPIYETVLTPYDTAFAFSSNLSFAPNTGTRGLLNGIVNAATAIYNAPPRPFDIPANDNRLTVALDIGFWNGYLESSHFVLGVRYPADNYTKPGDNRCGAVILGNWVISEGSYVRAVALEEIEIDNSFKNVHRNDTSDAIRGSRRYRVILDSIYHNGLMMHEIRIKDHPTGRLVYTTPATLISDYTDNYTIESTKIALATISGNGEGDGFYSNLYSYWSIGTEWVENP